ncbi:hypothetical protein [Nocardia sp. A7]|uniref:hypothetical protein n=1 Tax=Nocardia sp. A7 TaxID=2789274 RepID=UPI0039785E09
MDPLTVVDEIFLRTHRGMGTPIALQGLWRTPDAMKPVLLQEIHHRLRLGQLGRRVVNPRVPGARRTWHPNTNAHPLDLLPNHAETDWPATPVGDHEFGPLPEHAILAWADTLGTDLDPEYGPGWRLSAARLEDGGTVVALTCSHALADARGLIHAVTAALRSLEPDSTGESPMEAVSAGPPHTHPTPTVEIRDGAASSEWADAASQWLTIFGGTAKALHRKLPRPLARRTWDKPSDVPREPGPVSGGTSADTPPLSTAQHPRSLRADTTERHLRPILLTFDAAHWDATAITLGGTANSLFIHLVANILWHSGFPNPTITASLPVDTRDEPRVDNDLAMTEIAVQHHDTPAAIRDKAKAAYQRRISSPAGLPEEILQVVPDRLAYILSKGAGERDILCSNIGPLPDTVRRIGPHDCTRVAARAIHPGITTFPRTQLAGYLSRLDSTYTLALVGLAADNDFLTEAIEKSCAAMGLISHPW